MNTLYLHIGTKKTGTKSIQHFCCDNQKILHTKGYCYPASAKRYEGIASVKNGHFLLAEDCQSKEGCFREQMDQIVALFQDHPNIILSDEGIYDAPHALWEVLKKESEEGGFQIKVVVYLRRQDLYLASIWNQNVKSNGRKRTWNEYISRERSNKIECLQYATRLDQIASVIGKEQMIVRRFEPESFKNGSLYADFLKAIGLDLTEEYQIGQPVRNTGLSGNTHEIMRILNRMPEADPYSKFFRDALLSYASQSGQDYPCGMFSPSEAKRFLKGYRNENRQVAKDYFGEADLFHMDFTDQPKWKRENHYMLDDVIRFVAACCIQMMEKNLHLKQLEKENRAEISRLKEIIGELSEKVM